MALTHPCLETLRDGSSAQSKSHGFSTRDTVMISQLFNAGNLENDLQSKGRDVESMLRIF